MWDGRGYSTTYVPTNTNLYILSPPTIYMDMDNSQVQVSYDETNEARPIKVELNDANNQVYWFKTEWHADRWLKSQRDYLRTLEEN